MIVGDDDGEWSILEQVTRVCDHSPHTLLPRVCLKRFYHV